MYHSTRRSSSRIAKPASRPGHRGAGRKLTGNAEAWSEFTQYIPGNIDEEDVNAAWLQFLDGPFRNKGDDEMTPADWDFVRYSAPEMLRSLLARLADRADAATLMQALSQFGPEAKLPGRLSRRRRSAAR